uniref:Uncharacterized protein n=1 Tax=Arundo donax TaxID=35708 RepID=A0A0A9HRL7_ARUDO
MQQYITNVPLAATCRTTIPALRKFHKTQIKKCLTSIPKGLCK